MKVLYSLGAGPFINSDDNHGSPTIGMNEMLNSISEYARVKYQWHPFVADYPFYIAPEELKLTFNKTTWSAQKAPKLTEATMQNLLTLSVFYIGQAQPRTQTHDKPRTHGNRIDSFSQDLLNTCVPLLLFINTDGESRIIDHADNRYVKRVTQIHEATNLLGTLP